MDLSEVLRFRTFQLPGNPETDEYLLPVSGGADSSSLAILLHELAPTVRFRMVFTDTGAELPETYQMLDRLEAYLGRPIERIMEKDLFTLIREAGGFLPSPKDRFCTRALKLVPFKKWISQFEGKAKWMFIGIRSDESFRVAFTLPDVETVFPFIDLGIGREWVYKKLSATVGIPASYRTRTRSGCTVCPYQRVTELVGLYQEHPVEFEQGSLYEKLSTTDASRHAPGVALWQDTSLARNWQSLPVPLSESAMDKGSLAKAKRPDLFGSRVFVGGEFFYDGWLSNDEFIWQQRLVSFSPTLDGIRKQLDSRFQHLLSTAEIHGMTPEEVREKVRFAIWYIELPSEVFDPAGIGAGAERSYTWHQGKSYRQIRHVVDWATRALHAEYQRRLAAEQHHPMTVQYEWSEGAKETINEVRHACGSVLLSEWYQPSEKEVEPETEEEALSLMPCPMCNI